MLLLLLKLRATYLLIYVLSSSNATYSASKVFIGLREQYSELVTQVGCFVHPDGGERPFEYIGSSTRHTGTVGSSPVNNILHTNFSKVSHQFSGNLLNVNEDGFLNFCFFQCLKVGEKIPIVKAEYLKDTEHSSLLTNGGQEMDFNSTAQQLDFSQKLFIFCLSIFHLIPMARCRFIRTLILSPKYIKESVMSSMATMHNHWIRKQKFGSFELHRITNSNDLEDFDEPKVLRSFAPQGVTHGMNGWHFALLCLSLCLFFNCVYGAHLDTIRDINKSGFSSNELTPGMVSLTDDNYSFVGESLPVADEAGEIGICGQGELVLLVGENSRLIDLSLILKEAKYSVGVIRDDTGIGEMVKSSSPHLILCDISAANRIGFGVCAEVKRSEDTAHIPVIMIVEGGGAADELAGLRVGSDSYLTKPVVTEVLLFQISNLIKLSSTNRKQCTLHSKVLPSKSNVGHHDKDMLERLANIVESNLSDPNFLVPDLARSAGMSQASLYNFVRKVAGLTVNQFIKRVRLNKAAELLTSGKINVNETAMLVGFEDRKYFSKEFRKHFGMLPKNYAMKC